MQEQLWRYFIVFQYLYLNPGPKILPFLLMNKDTFTN